MTGVLTSVADIIDPDAVVERPELATPTTLAARLDPLYQVRDHLTLIGEELAKLEAGDEFDRLMINTPPRVGKTRLAVEWFCFWWLIKHPTHRIIVASYDDSLAQRAGKHIRALVERYGAAYGLILEHGSTAAKDWSLSTGGGVRSVGIGSGITGHDGDLLIFDDPTKSRAEAESALRRDGIYDWWSAEFSTRVVPGTRILGIQTPWHPDDLRVRIINQEGRVENGGRWREVIMAALAEDPNDPLGRAPGEPLPHPKIAEGDTNRLGKWWERIRSAIAVRDWRALYQCDPKAPEGQLVTWDLLRERRCHEKPGGCAERGRSGVAVDPSGGGRDTAGVIAGHLDADGRCVFTHDRSGVMATADWARAACELAVEVGAEFFCYETNFGGDQAELILKSAWRALRDEDPDRFSIFMPRIIPVSAGRKGKLLRAEPIAQQWKEDRCRTGAYLPDLESEWATWTVGGASPGRIDASVYLAYELLPVPSTGDGSLAGVAMMMDTDLLGQRGLWGR